MKNLILKKLTIHLLLFLFLVFQTQAQSALQVKQVSITVSDLNKAIQFYKEVLTFEVEAMYQIASPKLNQLFNLEQKDLRVNAALLKLGDEKIELMEFVNEGIQHPIPPDSRSNDLWFQHIAIVVSDMDKAYQWLRKHKIQHVSTAPQRLPEYLPAAAGISAFYFRDPDKHNLEIIHFPKGKGNPKWQNTKADQIFLGIDHTAIGVSDNDRGFDFYEKKLGLAIAGNSENYGSEQEHLNQVFGAHLLITGLKAKEGMGVEFLNYLSPPGGRPYPVESQVTDLWHWHTTIGVQDAEALRQELQKTGFSVISKNCVDLSDTPWKFKKAFLVRDPDGHAILITQL